MRRALPALGVTAVSLGFLLSFETRGEEAAVLAAGDATVELDRDAATTAPAPPTATDATATPGTTPAPAATTDAPDPTAAPDPSPTGAAPGGSGTVVVTGPVADTRFGPVQVQVTVTDGTITDVQTLQAPNEDRKSRAINQRAIPVYNAAALQAQSAQIDSVSGATVTWRAYTASLQAALDAAGV